MSNDTLYIEPGAKAGWYAPKLSKQGQSGTVFTLRYDRLALLLKNAGLLDHAEEMSRLRISKDGIDVFVDRAPRTVGESLDALRKAGL